MPISTAEREKRLTDAIDHFHAHNGSISVRKVALQFQVSHVTFVTNSVNRGMSHAEAERQPVQLVVLNTRI
jgi:hypothetical protein